MKDFIEGLLVLLLGCVLAYTYVQIICDGYWLCAFDSSPRTCATIQRMEGVK